MPRLDLLSDPHEGSTPRLLASQRDQYFREQGLERIIGHFQSINQQLRTASYVSCWHAGNQESEAMWRLYCPSNEGVAIRTSYQKLVDSVAHDSSLHIGAVTYLDYETGGYPLTNVFYPLMHKRISFAHENEIRIVKLDMELSIGKTVGPVGITVDWDIDNLIEEIFIDPYAPEYYAEIVRPIVAQFAPNLESRVHWSQMRSAPVY